MSLIVLLVAAVSCHDGGLEDDIIGKWEIQESTCFGCPVMFTTYPEGNGNILIFKSNGAYERRENNVAVFKGKYSIKKSEVCDKEDDALHTNESPGTTSDIVSIESGKLQLNTPPCLADGGITVYRRLK